MFLNKQGHVRAAGYLSLTFLPDDVISVALFSTDMEEFPTIAFPVIQLLKVKKRIAGG